ncbi:MAG TPA: transporter substrate-binding domain-containing protein [Beijerinckiaceae bacterium]|nr:transporter substrate-binding domain-containing protein [Beijerinckiaceae bacterium]
MAKRVTAILLACCLGLSAAAQDRPASVRPATTTPATTKPTAARPAAAKPAADKAAAKHKAAKDKLAADKSVSDKPATDNAATDRAPTDNAAPDKLAGDKAAPDKPVTDKAATEPAAAQPTLRIATEGACPPFNYLDAGTEPQGFEIELGKALCQEMAVTCTFVVHEWDGIIRGLLAKDYDAIMASLAMTPRRKARIAFSKRYYFIPPAFIGPKDSDIRDVSPAGLAGKRVGTTENSHHAAFLEARYPDADLRVYSKLDEANLDLLTGRIDLVLGDKLALSRFLEAREGACCRFVADAPADPEFYGEGVGIGLRKEDKDLKERLNRGLERLIANGTYDAIRAKYFAFDTK